MDPIQRVDALLARMSLEEKAFQLTSVMGPSLFGADGADPQRLAARLGHGIGQVSGLAGFGARPPAEVARAVNQVQRFLVEETRLGIPAIFHNEAFNGVMAPGFTVFPTAIGLAAAWDPQAVERVAVLIGRQMRAVGMRQALAPVLDVARDARWGRVHETYGEDPYLVSALGVAYVRGLQSQDVIATAKHFLGYAVTEGCQNMAATAVGARELYEVHARPFEAAIHLAGLGAVMNSYSEYDGVPIGASRAILTELLRERMGFTGTVAADYMTVEWLASRQAVAADKQQAGLLALAAGLDVELPEIAGYGPALAEAVEAGRIGEDVLDRSVSRVLRDKFALGLFENPYVEEDPVAIGRTAAEGAGLARELARKSVTLLKNEDGVLPLAPGVRKIAVVGPLADDVTAAFPAYTYPAMRRMLTRSAASAMPGTESVSDGLSSSLAAQLAAATALSGDAWIRAEYDALSLAEAVRQALPKAEVTSIVAAALPDGGTDDIPAAVAAARDADVVILALGGPRRLAARRHHRGGGQRQRRHRPARRAGPAGQGGHRDRNPCHRRRPDRAAVRDHVRRGRPEGRGMGVLRRPAGHAGRRRHPDRPAVRVRARPELYDVQLRRAGPRTRRGPRRRDGHRVRAGHQHRRARRRRGRPALFPRHRHRPAPARPGARRLPAHPAGPRSNRHRRVHGPAEPARVPRPRRHAHP